MNHLQLAKTKTIETNLLPHQTNTDQMTQNCRFTATTLTRVA